MLAETANAAPRVRLARRTDTVAESAGRMPLRQRLLDGRDPATMSLPELCDRCASVLDSAGVTIELSSERDTAVTESTPVAARQLADLQTRLGEGPTIDALGSHRAVFTNDLAGDARWPHLGGAEEFGYGPAIAVPLRVDSTQLGALTAYYDRATVVDAASVMRAEHLGQVLTGVLLALPVPTSNGLATAISIAAAHQAQIHQAAGIVSAQMSCSLEEAAVRMRAHAYAHDQELADVAEAIVSNELRLS